VKLQKNYIEIFSQNYTLIAAGEFRNNLAMVYTFSLSLSNLTKKIKYAAVCQIDFGTSNKFDH